MGEVGEVIPEKQQNEVGGKITEDEDITTTVLESVSQNGEVTNGIHKDDDQLEIEDDEVEMEEEDDDEEDKNNNEDGQEIEDEEMSQSYDESTKNTEDEVSNGVNDNPIDQNQMETDDDSQSQQAQNKVDEDVEVIPSDDDEGSQDPLATKEPHDTRQVDSAETVKEKIVESVELSDDEDKPSEPAVPTQEKQRPESTKSANNHVEDDDDDCVVIDDDDDEPPPIIIDTLKKVRSFATMDEVSEIPPSKRQRTSGIQIKDARSLISSPSTTITPVSSKTPQTPTSATHSAPSVHIYPVGLRASSNTTSPPKLVPVSNSSTTSGNVKDLLPGLTDDMFVLEAPSFIVPYIYEKPPENTLISVVKKLEEKFDLKNSIQDDEKENLLDEDVEKAIDEASKTVNNQEDPEGGGKKRKRKNGDDSWSEGSDVDEHEEDEDSDSVERTKVLIKDAGNELAVLKNAIKPAAISTSPKTNTVANGTQKVGDKGGDNFFESPLGKFFTDLGIGFVQEFVQSDLLKIQKRKFRKTQHTGEASVIEKAVNALKENLHTSRKHNAPFRFDMKRCEYCSFKSESALSLALHYQTPHMNGVMYRCNYCPFEIRSSHEIIQHMDYVHNVKARIEKNPSYHACPNCPYEENGKAKLARHAIVCAKKFRPEVNLAPPQDWEAPAKIPRVKPRHGLVGTATAYQAMAAQAAAQKAVLETMQLQQQQRSMNMQNSKPRSKNKTSNGGINKNNAALRNVPGLLPNNFQIQGGQLVQAAQNSKRHSTGSQQPSISITPLPRHSNSNSPAAAASTSNSLCANLKMLPAGLKPGQSPAAGAKFVICEICDGYIKDLEQLRNHMQWMHKVKIHPKMIYNRPPLNCQKCQFRFFTDQGLERHLLGSHGLVTSSMQEAANKGKDSGRCPVCGRMYQWKLLNHVSRDHHMTLKPAHLSYKCTVCTATFGMYKQFETHVYTAHSTVAKKQLDGKKNSSSGSNSTRGSSTNDNLLKPLKINDEITIIPQPSSKATRTIDID